MYQYLIYGLTVYADTPIYNLPTVIGSIGSPDITITRGAIIDEPFRNGAVDVHYTTDFVCFKVECGIFSISHGKNILYEPSSGATEIQIATTIIGWGFAFLFSQRGYTALHCTALNIKDNGVLISGASGAGKSTIALSLVKKGYQYLADDMAMFNPPESFDIVPAYPIQKVCLDTAGTLNAQNLLYIDEDRDKYSYCNTSDFCSAPVKLRYIFKLRSDDIPSVMIEEITGLNKYLRTLECLFLAETYLFAGTPNGDKYRCLLLAEQVRLFTITRPRNGDTVREITDAILRLSTV